MRRSAACASWYTTPRISGWVKLTRFALDPHQAGGLGLAEMPDVGPGTQAGGGDHRQLGPGVRRGDQQRPPGLLVQRADPARERALQPPSRREREVRGAAPVR